MDCHATDRPVGDTGSESVHIANLEADAFELLKKRIEYDLKCLKAYRSKLESHETAEFHAQLTHRKNAYDASVTAAKKLLAANVKVLTTNQLHTVMQDYNNFVDQFCKAYGLRKDAVVQFLVS